MYFIVLITINDGSRRLESFFKYDRFQIKNNETTNSLSNQLARVDIHITLGTLFDYFALKLLRHFLKAIDRIPILVFKTNCSYLSSAVPSNLVGPITITKTDLISLRGFLEIDFHSIVNFDV